MIILLPSIIFAQETDSLVKPKTKFEYDTLKIVAFPKHIAVYFNVSGKMNDLDIQSNTSNAQLQFSPNEITSIGLGLDYKWIGIGASFNFAFMNRDDEIYGKTEKLDFQINYYHKRFGIDTYFKYHKGFYLSNPDDFVNWPYEEFPLLQDMEVVGVGLSAYYVFNYKKFSYKAAFPRTMWQKKSSGSLLAGVYINMNACNAPSGIVPTELPDSLTTKFDIFGFSNSHLGVSFGYTYTFVIKKRFFTNLTVVPGFGVARPTVTNSNGSVDYDANFAASVVSRLSIGYEGRKLYYGFNVVSIINNFNYEDIEVSSTTGNIRFYIGKRFHLDKWFKSKRKSKVEN